MSLINKTDASRFSFVRAFRNWRGGASENPTLYQKSETGLWYETINPLRGLTVDKAAMIFDRARLGVYAELQYLYNEIEAADPTLFVCTERREAAAGSCEWRIARANPERVAAYDEALADDQSAYLYAAYGNAADEIGALAEHLSRAFFRGFAHARAIISADGVEGFEFFDTWNFARDPSTGDWWWNPDAVSWANDNFRPIPPGELISLTRSRHIDYPSLFIFIRAALGDRQWGVFLERFGIPPVTIIMPEFADKSEESAYMSAAQKLAAAGSGALPFGSEVSYASDSRSVNPFLDFLRRQQELTVLMATGGLLTTLTAPGSGTLAGEAHLDTWREVVRRDIRSVSRAINRSLTSRLLSARFPGQPHLAYLEFDADPAPSADQIFETAAKARAAGYLVERSELSDRTGYKLDLDDTGIDPFAGPTTWRTSLPKPEKIAAIGDQVDNKAAETLKNIIASHCKTHGSEITNKDSAETAPALERILAPISGISADPIKAALDVIENGGSEDEAMAAYDQAAAAVLSPEKIAEGAEEISRVLEQAAKEGKIMNKFNPNQPRDADGKWTADSITTREIKSDDIESMREQYIKAVDEDDYSDYGFRMLPDDNDNYDEGDTLPNSFEWNDGNRSEIELEGTSVTGISNIESFENDFKKFQENGYFGKKVALIKGISQGSGYDIGEEILSDATVVKIWNVGVTPGKRSRE